MNWKAGDPPSGPTETKEPGRDCHPAGPASPETSEKEQPMNSGENSTTSAGPASDDGIMTVEELAATNFDAWRKDGKGGQPPSNLEWTQLAPDILPPLRLAYATMFKTKDELVASVKSDPELFFDLMDEMKHSEDWFRACEQMLEAAGLRVLVAVSVHAMSADGDVS